MTLDLTGPAASYRRQASALRVQALLAASARREEPRRGRTAFKKRAKELGLLGRSEQFSGPGSTKRRTVSPEVEYRGSQMASDLPRWDQPSIRQRIQRFIQTKVWRMDIHPSAQIAASALIDRNWPRGVHIAEGVIICEEVVVLTHDITRGLLLDTWIGAKSILMPRAIVLPGVAIGENCVVMPGALVTRDLPPASIASGNPASFSARPV
jgi:acetyltransferase-like isoleucine patch superfamily enzyme